MDTNPTYNELLERISELKKENQRLKQNQQLLQNNADLLVWGTNTAVWEWHYKTGVVRFSDKKAEILGYKPEELRQDVTAFTEMIHPDDYEQAMDNMRNHLTGKTDVYEVEYRIKTKSGQYKWFYDKGKVTQRDEQGNPLKIVGIVNDITEKNNSIRKLIKSEEQFRGFFENANIGIRIVNSDGIITEENQALRNITEYHNQENIGKHISDVVFEQIPEHRRNRELYHYIKNRTEILLKAGEVSFSNQKKYNELQCKSGAIKTVSTSYYTLKTESGFIFYAIIKDETEKIRYQQQLELRKNELKTALNIAQENEAKYKLIAENTSDGILVINAENIITYASPSHVKLSGIDENILVGANAELIAQYVHPDDKETVFKAVFDAIAQKKDNLIYSYRAKKRNGEYYWREDHAKFIYSKEGVYQYVNVVSRDITKRVEIEKQKDYFSTIIENTNSICVVKDLNLRVIASNQSFAEAAGKASVTDLIGKTDAEIFDVSPEQEPIRSYMADEKTVQHYKKGQKLVKEEPLLHADGTVHTVLTTKFPVFDANNRLIATANLSADITELKQKQKQLIIAKEKAEESDQLKMAFLNNISHEFRTPLNGLFGFIEILLRENSSAEKKQKYAEIIRESATRLLSIVTDTIEIAKIQSRTLVVKNVRINFSQFFNEIIHFYGKQAQSKGLALRYNIQSNEQPLWLITDKQKLEYSIRHIVENAIKYTPTGSINIDCRVSSNFLQIKITDTGIGISPEIQKIVFEPYRQAETGTARNYGGLGLGLALIKGYIELLGGNIELQSEPDKGTQITISMAIQNANQHENSTARNKTINQLKTRNATVLIVEDQEINFQFLNELLLNTGVKTIVRKTNGQEAVDYVRANPEIDLIFMDIKMPVLDGYEATKQIKRINPRITIIAQTAYVADSELEKLKANGFEDILIKPFNHNDVAAIINQYTNN